MSDQNNNTEQGKPSFSEKISRGFSKKPFLYFGGLGLFIAIIGLLLFPSFSSESKAKEENTATKDQTSGEGLNLYKVQDPVVNEVQSNETLEKVEVEEPKEEEKPPLPEEVAEPEVAPVTEVATVNELPPPYYEQESSTGEKQLTREEKIFQSDLMADGGKSTTYKDTAKDGAKGPEPGQHFEGELTESLKSVATPGVKATRIHPRKHPTTLSKGTFIGCTLKTRMDTTVPGLTTCVINQDVYSMDGKTLLIERGSNIIGEYTGAVQNGLERIFVLWTQIRTPNGINIDINSPAADQIGGAGMGGQVDHHWFKRFGSALMFSIVGDAFQFGINSANSHKANGDVTYNQTSDAMNEIVKEAMAQAGNIPPTLIKNQGEKVGVTVARDIDFSSVYKLKYKYENYYN